MRLYLDDDSVDPSLIRLLRRDGHDVEIPADVGLFCEAPASLPFILADRFLASFLFGGE